jgi:hypothetical protein
MSLADCFEFRALAEWMATRAVPEELLGIDLADLDDEGDDPDDVDENDEDAPRAA